MKEKATAAKNVTPKVHNTSDISIILTKALLSQINFESTKYHSVNCMNYSIIAINEAMDLI